MRVNRHRAVSLLRALLLVAVVGSVIAGCTPTTPPSAPAGVTAIALDGKVGLAWKAAASATSYTVFRGTSPSSITQKVSPANLSATTFTDTTAQNGTAYYYAVRATNSAGSSGSSPQLAKSTPRARSCSTGNRIVVENCFPGTTDWSVTDGAGTFNNGIEGYASASSVNAGDSVAIRTATDSGVPYHIEIYRTGYYGGSQGRLVSVIPGLDGTRPPGCERDPGTTGLVDCGQWASVATVTTTSDWTSGTYFLKLVREDNGNASVIPLVVRNDGSNSNVLYGVPTATYQAYDRFGGKSLYTYLSDGPATITGANRAIEVSFDRPYSQPTEGSFAHDWYGRTDVAEVSWLEQQGYDLTYIASEDLHSNGAQLKNHRVFISGAHDEYWSKEMFDAAIAARASGTSLFFSGANAAYWRVRFAAGPQSGAANRLMIGYKTVESGPADPSGTPTSTWRDPAGPNRPENELVGQMYVGDNPNTFFPLQVSAAQGQNRVWRHTSLASLPAGTTADIGTDLVGWEWDARAQNGAEPPGVTTVAGSSVTGGLIQGNGAFTTQGDATATATIYRASSGAYVFSTGTNHWWRGLAKNQHGQGTPDVRIQQATVNILSDMGATPTTPAGNIQLDSGGAPAVRATVPSDGAAAAKADEPLVVSFDRQLDPTSVSAADFSVTGPGGESVPVDRVAVDNAAEKVTLTLGRALDPMSDYRATVDTDVKSWAGDRPPAATSWRFTTGQGTTPRVSARTPAPDATGVATDATVGATFDRRLAPRTVNAETVELRPAGGGSPVAARVDYLPATRTVRLTPAAPLEESRSYRVTLASGLHAVDGTPVIGEAWTFTTGLDLAIAGREPVPGAVDVAPGQDVHVTFSRRADPASITPAGFRLTNPAGDATPAAVSYDPTSQTATLHPDSSLEPATYTAHLGGVRAADGGALPGLTWAFTVAGAAPAAPQVTGTTPAGGAAHVAPGEGVSAVFDQPLDPDSVTGRTFTLTPDGGDAVEAVVTYDSGAERVVLKPRWPLAPGARYTASLGGGIRSQFGLPVSDLSWWFTVVSGDFSTDTLQPSNYLTR
jgi:hypothetical protein